MLVSGGVSEMLRSHIITLITWYLCGQLYLAPFPKAEVLPFFDQFERRLRFWNPGRAGRCYGRPARWLGSRCVDPGNYTPRWDVEKPAHMRRNIQVLVSISNFEGCTLPETNISHLKMDGWNTIVSFWNGKFSGTVSMLVSGRVTFWTQQMEV